MRNDNEYPWNVPRTTLEEIPTPEGLERFRSAHFILADAVFRDEMFVLFGGALAKQIQAGEWRPKATESIGSKTVVITVTTPGQLRSLCYVCTYYRGECDYRGPEFDDNDRAEAGREPRTN